MGFYIHQLQKIKNSNDLQDEATQEAWVGGKSNFAGRKSNFVWKISSG